MAEEKFFVLFYFKKKKRGKNSFGKVEKVFISNQPHGNLIKN